MKGGLKLWIGKIYNKNNNLGVLFGVNKAHWFYA